MLYRDKKFISCPKKLTSSPHHLRTELMPSAKKPSRYRYLNSLKKNLNHPKNQQKQFFPNCNTANLPSIANNSSQQLSYKNENLIEIATETSDIIKRRRLLAKPIYKKQLSQLPTNQNFDYYRDIKIMKKNQHKKLDKWKMDWPVSHKSSVNNKIRQVYQEQFQNAKQHLQIIKRVNKRCEILQNIYSDKYQLMRKLKRMNKKHQAKKSRLASTGYETDQESLNSSI